MKTRLEEGYELFLKLHGKHSGEALVNTVGEICPDFPDLTADIAFGCIFNRPGLSIKIRELMVISLCTALGDMSDQLTAHLEAAVRCGASKEECVESILQACLYAGFARVANALLVAKEFFQNNTSADS